jgi:hypothetical protein
MIGIVIIYGVKLKHTIYNVVIEKKSRERKSSGSRVGIFEKLLSFIEYICIRYTR